MAKDNLLQNVAPGKEFYSQHGEVYKNLHELVDALHKIPSEVFVHHANSAKNDFAKWICDVFSDQKLADKIQPIMNPITMSKHISVRLMKKQ